MSVFPSFILRFGKRLRNTNSHSPDVTEMMQIDDLEEILATVDSRNRLVSPEHSDHGEEEEEDSSLSSSNNNSSTENLSSAPQTMRGTQTSYYDEEEDDNNPAYSPFHGNGRDEAQQRLFNDDLETGGAGRGNDAESIASFDRAKGKDKGNRRWACIGFLAILVFGWILWTVSISKFGQAIMTEEDADTPRHIDFDDLYNASFYPKRPTLRWVKNDPRDGVFTYRDPTTDDILLETVEDGKTEVLVKMSNLQLDQGHLEVASFEISGDAEYLLLWTNVTSQWRHSTRSNIYVYNVKNHSLFPLTEDSVVGKDPKVSYATWSPTGHRVAYVMENDLYVTDLVNTNRLTFDGSPTVFNGVPDWVYEEEVFEANYALWWSPDSTHLAYLRFDETAVPEYYLSFYTTSNSSYPEEVSIRYPKAGAPNPLVSLHIHSLLENATITVTTNSTSGLEIHAASGYEDFEVEDRLITDVAWATETHTHLLFKQMNRVQDHELTSLVSVAAQLNESTVKEVRRYQPSDGGWIEVAQSIVYLPSTKSHGKSSIRYIDLADNDQGYLHLAVFNADSKAGEEPLWLTSGEWEVIPGTVVMDMDRQLLHFVSVERSPLERHLYRISLSDEDPASTKVCVTCPDDPEVHGYYSASFSPKAGYYVLNYEGPEIPTTVVKKVDNATFELVLEDNRALKELLDGYELPRRRMVTVQSGGVDMNGVEILPPDFNAAEKYPVLFSVYGGPGSQKVSYQFDLSWHTFLASKLRYIVVSVDGRGTGYRGREYKTCVRKRLGELETIDQVNAGKHWASLDYVDPARIAIWGWSYGGYMTSKVIESNDGVFSVGMAVAPVTDWRYYDSIYTERYMLTPELNPEGYEHSAVNNMTGFENARYLLVHGTGDDNVHFQHSAVLVDKLTLATIHNYRVQFYPDSNHAINHHMANPSVYYLLTEFLWESFGGKEYLHFRKETHGRFSGPLQDHY